MGDHEYYDTPAVIRHFDEMSASYSAVNDLSSFGFASRWRRLCIGAADFPPSARVLDLMTGTGELIPLISRRLGGKGSITALDIAPNMVLRARRRDAGSWDCPVEIVQGDALTFDFPPNAFDAVVSAFGLKTFSDGQLHELAQRVHRVLVPGGVFSFVEVCAPSSPLLRTPYLLYVRKILPLISKAMNGDAAIYRRVGEDIAAFDAGQALTAFKAAGLESRLTTYFAASVAGISGVKEQAFVP